jgi:16S rRNA (guanine966-N2)-methyltransferase
MRIIAGSHRGRPFLSPPEDRPTRPITDRAKETIFNRLNSLGMFGLEDEDGNPTPFNVADVFSGTGSLGLESLSRGASEAVFIEMDRTVRGLLDENLKAFGWQSRARVLAANALSPTWMQAFPAGHFRVIFLDPPYVMLEDQSSRGALQALVGHLAHALEDGGLVVLRTPMGNTMEEVSQMDGPVMFDVGTMSFHLWQKPMSDDMKS